MRDSRMSASNPNYQHLVVESRGPALWITLHRPTSKNSFNLEMGKELLNAMRSGIHDKQHSVIVLNGAGEAFSAGGDIKVMHKTLQGKNSRKNIKKFFLTISKLVNTTVLEMRKSPKPIIAAIPGFAGGIAFGAVLATDLRIASTHAQFSAATIRLGLVANGSATYHLPRLVGLAKASEIFLLGNNFSAEDALRMGLINRVVDPNELDSVTQEIAEKLASSPRKALARVKNILNHSLASTLPLQLERERQSIAWSSTLSDFREGVEAFVEKRKARFNLS